MKFTAILALVALFTAATASAENPRYKKSYGHPNGGSSGGSGRVWGATPSYSSSGYTLAQIFAYLAYLLQQSQSGPNSDDATQQFSAVYNSLPADAQAGFQAFLAQQGGN